MILTIGLSNLMIALLGAGLAVRISRNTRLPEQPVPVQSAPVLSVVPVSVGHDHNEFRLAA